MSLEMFPDSLPFPLGELLVESGVDTTFSLGLESVLPDGEATGAGDEEEVSPLVCLLDVRVSNLGD